MKVSMPSARVKVNVPSAREEVGCGRSEDVEMVVWTKLDRIRNVVEGQEK